MCVVWQKCPYNILDCTNSTDWCGTWTGSALGQRSTPAEKPVKYEKGEILFSQSHFLKPGFVRKQFVFFSSSVSPHRHLWKRNLFRNVQSLQRRDIHPCNLFRVRKIASSMSWWWSAPSPSSSPPIIVVLLSLLPEPRPVPLLGEQRRRALTKWGSVVAAAQLIHFYLDWN